MTFIQAIISVFKNYLPTCALIIGMILLVVALFLLFGFKWALLSLALCVIAVAILINREV